MSKNVAKLTISSKQQSSYGPIGSFFRKAFVALALASFVATPAWAAKYAGIVLDANNGKVLYGDSANSKRYPASLTKMMTLYLVFEALNSGKIHMGTPVPMTRHAAGEAPSKLGLPAGRTFTVKQGILALVTRSANDVATAFGEFLAGSEPAFGRMMTAKARSLGMSRTIYVNANGLPDARQVTTAHDQALLGIALRQHFPQYYHFFSTRSFRFGKQLIGNHNHLLGRVKGVDGIKTGYTRAAGFNLATSAKVGGHSIVVVVMGEPTSRTRNAKVTKLVQHYLPRSSSGKRTFAIARSVPAQIVNKPLPVAVPVPKNRYNNRIDMAFAEPAAEADGKKALEKQLVKMTAEQAAEDAAKAPKAEVDQLTTASTKAEASGWVIQVGAAESPQLAKKLLQKAQEKGGRVLRSADPYTVAFNNEGAKLYRARFSGFDNQKSAVNACRQLKRHGMGCWASMN